MTNKFISFTSTTQLLIKEALRRKIEVVPIYPRRLLKLVYKKHIEYIFNQQISKTSCVAFEICNYKQITKEVLSRAGLNVSKAVLVEPDKIDKYKKQIARLKFPVIVKPIGGAHGTSVYTNIDSFLKLKKITDKLKEYKELLVEEQFFGTDYRIFATSKKVLGILERIPANVTGDGKHSIKKLIEIKNQDPRRGDKTTYAALQKIEIDDAMQKYLKLQKLSLSNIPKTGKTIYLRKNANISTGGDSIDRTDDAHKSLKHIAIKAIKAIPGLCFGGVDIMTKDIKKNQGINDYIILEINASAGFDIHTFPYMGKSRDIAKEIIDIAFPETK